MVMTSFRTRAAIPAAIGAVTAAIAVAPTAYADDSWGAIAVSPDGESVGVSTDQANEYLANKAANEDCQQDSAVCNVLITFKAPDCGAVVTNGEHYFGDSGATRQEAEENATSQSPGSTLLRSECNGDTDEGEGASTTPTSATETTAPATETTESPTPGG